MIGRCMIRICIVLAVLSAAIHAADPVITDVFSADPPALVVGDTAYLRMSAMTRCPMSGTTGA